MTLAALIIAMLLLNGCGQRNASSVIDLVGPYEQALQDFPGSTAALAAGIERFKTTFSDFTDPQLEAKIRATYAERLFFNDTLHSFHRLDDLADYMARTGEAVSASRVTVHQVVTDGVDVYVRWSMEFRTRAVGRDVHSHSIGMSHLRFDEDGRVVLHQDFWDSGHGLYAHLPFVGFAVRRARRAL
ncbi:MAG: nuclear transport factor 2 family protein [Wenzhouxiangella sp.]